MRSTQLLPAAVPIAFLLLASCSTVPDRWQSLETSGPLTARHEASFVNHRGRLYLMGGRRINPVESLDPLSLRWKRHSSTPIELHHFQAVSLGDAIYIVGAMTGPYPGETPVDRVIKYLPDQDRFEWSHEIPDARQRGAAGAVAYDGKIYILGGITDGHRGGYRAWFDEYDPTTGEWRTLPDAPDARDHFHAVVLHDKLYAFGGRRTSQATGETLSLTTNYGNVFDFATNRWLPVTQDLAIPTPRAGAMVHVWGSTIVIAGGESDAQIDAHSEVEAYDTRSRRWLFHPRLQVGRHGSGLAQHGDYLYVASGSGQRGGEPELLTLERYRPENGQAIDPGSSVDDTRVHKRWHTITLSFAGPDTSENAIRNPFTDYRLTVTFKQGDSIQTIRGFYAADGNAANSSAFSGNVWQARFKPDRLGHWSYRAELRVGDDIAISNDPDAGELVLIDNDSIDNDSGAFFVIPSDKAGTDFRAHGRLHAENGFFRFPATGAYWLKGGTNSPENFLGYAGFDGTQVAQESSRDGEAMRDNNLHRYEPHRRDWQPGDPLWGQTEKRGTGIIGAVNYLASTGMNAAYFLTLNVDGDGNDVWPYLEPTAFDRFDVSKLDQWEVVFQHMQKNGILLHLVTQETENERLLDGGETGRLRQLYYQELMARFGHHLALVWNLGEENGPADFSPNGQTAEHRIAMANYFAAHDPYDHPVLIHTHSSAEGKHEILGPLLGLQSLSGASFQVDDRRRVNKEVAEWRAAANAAGKDWLITMDEIGMWHTGALPDSEDPNHDSLRRHALWGAILGGAAGVEWYFGARYPANDLNSEDWRRREQLWRQTKRALDFFSIRRYWTYNPCNQRVGPADYCAGVVGTEFVLYLPRESTYEFDATGLTGTYRISWFDPKSGEGLEDGSLSTLVGGDRESIGAPPIAGQRDWVVLLSAE